MLYRTHIITALAVSTTLISVGILDKPYFGFITFGANFLWFLGLIILGSLLPDIDHANSFISRKFGFSLPIKHRGFTHTIYPWFFLIGLSFFYENNYLINSLFYIGIGGLLHSFGDCHTKNGVRLLYFNKPNHVLPNFMLWSGKDDIEIFWFAFYSIIFFLNLSVIFT